MTDTSKFTLVTWEFKNIRVSMLQDKDGKLYCTSTAICSALGISGLALRKIYNRRQDRFSENCVTKCHAISALQENKEALGIKYLRGDMRLWREDDMLKFAIYSTSVVSDEFVDHLIAFIKQNARVGGVSREEHEAVQAEVRDTREQNRKLQELVESSIRATQALKQDVDFLCGRSKEMSSLAGSTLNAQKQVKGRFSTN